jgi:pyruvate formate lyase activating enzyme
MPVDTLIANITRGSMHDGSGIRTVIYFKGCNLKCKWCHNPECISFFPEILYADSKCIKCGICVETCANHLLIGSMHVFARHGCIACGKCAEKCPINALELCGKYISPDNLLKEILKDEHYYKTSSGGVTFSGGECLLHPEYVLELCKLCKENDVSITIETALNVPLDDIYLVMPYVESFYVDIKHMDDERHVIHTGNGNKRILSNLVELSKEHDSILIRIPLIPGINDSMENLGETAEFAISLGRGIKGVELLRYNILAKSKYSLQQKEYISFSNETQGKEYMDELCKMLNDVVGRKDFVFWKE